MAKSNYEYRAFRHPRFDAITLYKRADTDKAPWQYRFYISQKMNNGGKPISPRKSTNTSDRQTALEFAERRYIEALSETNKGEQVTLSGKPTLNDGFERIKTHYTQKISSGNARPSTWANIEKYYSGQIEPYLGNKPVDSVDEIAWNDFLGDLLKRKPDLRPDTIRLIKGALRAALKGARMKGFIKAVPDLGNDYSTTNNKTRRIWFDHREQDQLLKILDDNVESKTRKSDLYSAESLRDYCQMLLFTSVRPGELNALRFCDVSVDRQRVGNHIKSRLVIEIPHVEGAKMGARVAMGIPGSTEVYNNIKRRRGCDDDSKELLFDQKHHSKFRELLEEHDLRFDKNGNKRDFESLRHSFISNRLLEQEMDEFELSKWCGNSSKVIRENYARHLVSTHYDAFKKYHAKKAKQEKAKAELLKNDDDQFFENHSPVMDSFEPSELMELGEKLDFDIKSRDAKEAEEFQQGMTLIEKRALTYFRSNHDEYGGE